MVGDPDQIAQTLADLSRAGLRGIGFSFVNYLKELPYFCDEVLPRLERMGIRAKRKAARAARHRARCSATRRLRDTGSLDLHSRPP